MTSQRKPNQVCIRVSEPYPLLDPGDYIARCTAATFDWSQSLHVWKAILTLDLLNYAGRPYNGKLCKFLGLGKNPEGPYAGPRSDFRKLWVEVNGAQPTSLQVNVNVFVGHVFAATVETVTTNRKGESLATEHYYSVVRALRPLKPQEPLHPGNLKNFGNHGNQLTDQPSNRGNPPLGNAEARAHAIRAYDSFG